MTKEETYTSIIIDNNKVKFFTPNEMTKWRVDTFFTKEPETLEWIDSFDKKEKIIFWDIGSNIGLYSIYAALRFKNIEVVAFEPSTSNLRVLSRNISINKLENKIKITQIPLTNKENQYLLLREKEFIEGGALNSFGEKFDFEGKEFEGQNNYKVYGTSINYLIRNNILKVPNYIKIDVDGIEHLILDGASEYLNNNNIKSLSIELNENFEDQYNEVMKIMKNSNFNLKHKKKALRTNKQDQDEKFLKTYNFVFDREHR